MYWKLSWSVPPSQALFLPVWGNSLVMMLVVRLVCSIQGVAWPLSNVPLPNSSVQPCVTTGAGVGLIWVLGVSVGTGVGWACPAIMPDWIRAFLTAVSSLLFAPNRSVADFWRATA